MAAFAFVVCCSGTYTALISFYPAAYMGGIIVWMCGCLMAVS
jgi:hypothetical protein